ncbi:hypothetical protein ACFL21_00780 [Patescibacteria group bacterium]
MKENRLIYFARGLESHEAEHEDVGEKKVASPEEQEAALKRLEEANKNLLEIRDRAMKDHKADEQEAENLLGSLDELDVNENKAENRLKATIQLLTSGEPYSVNAANDLVENHLEFINQDGKDKLTNALVKNPGNVDGDVMNVLLSKLDNIKSVVLAKVENLLYLGKKYPEDNNLDEGTLKFLVDHKDDIPFGTLHDIQLHLDPKFEDAALVMSQLTGEDLSAKPVDQVESTPRMDNKANNRMERFQELVLSGKEIGLSAVEDIASYANIVGSKPIADMLKVANNSIPFEGVSVLLASIQNSLNPLELKDIVDAQVERAYESKTITHEALKFAVAFAPQISADKAGFLEAYMSDTQKIPFNNALS